MLRFSVVFVCFANAFITVSAANSYLDYFVGRSWFPDVKPFFIRAFPNGQPDSPELTFGKYFTF